ncbi:MAG: hypothetical protein DDT42_01841 [candidate division WS2 bacterium]|uniref:RiboL-PSP-HEPN domain-containing protein n=1 Tax=Psychracetigena formicireducens TaxID=2986056 RepID=A0A9E2F2Q1_PSYF1|nr:hypothetical protein [Candidatus Psychracetigena formicireducens]
MEYDKVFKEIIQIKESKSITTRKHFSIQNIQSAALFTRNAYVIEKNYDGVFSDELFSLHIAYVTASILFSVFFLEAAINELFADTVESNSEIAKKLNPTTIQLMAEMWKLEVPRTANYKILQKYQIALVLAQKQIFDPGNLPYQDVNLLVKLRNSLVHYEPEWVKSPASDDFGPDDIHTYAYEKKLRGKFLPNPLTGQGNPFYPDKCLGHGCAEWAVNSSVIFADAFFSRMGLLSPYDHIRDRLNTK